MKKSSSSAPNKITPAQRGQIVQRVIVDGWSSAQAAHTIGVPRRVVEAWVAEFRRNGMASLHYDPGQTFSPQIVRIAVSRPIRMMWRKISIGLRRSLLLEPHVQPV